MASPKQFLLAAGHAAEGTTSGARDFTIAIKIEIKSRVISSLIQSLPN